MGFSRQKNYAWNLSTKFIMLSWPMISVRKQVSLRLRQHWFQSLITSVLFMKSTYQHVLQKGYIQTRHIIQNFQYASGYFFKIWRKNHQCLKNELFNFPARSIKCNKHARFTLLTTEEDRFTCHENFCFCLCCNKSLIRNKSTLENVYTPF